LPSSLARSRKSRLGTELLCEYVFRPAAHLVVLVLLPLRVPPPAVVLASSAAGIAGAVELGRGSFVAAAVLIQVKTVLDNADGQLARLSGRVTAFGRYLDSECDLLVNAALFAALGARTHRPLLAAVAFVVVTGVLSLNFNLERLARGAPASSDASLLGRVYAVLYGWQDTLVERFVESRSAGRPAYHDHATIGVMANLGMTTQLAVLGVCLVAGHPLAFAAIALGELVLVGALFVRREFLVDVEPEVVLEHR
jgi:archaetidylinositol phosphate synthase